MGGNEKKMMRGECITLNGSCYSSQESTAVVEHEPVAAVVVVVIGIP